MESHVLYSLLRKGDKHKRKILVSPIFQNNLIIKYEEQIGFLELQDMKISVRIFIQMNLLISENLIHNYDLKNNFNNKYIFKATGTYDHN